MRNLIGTVVSTKGQQTAIVRIDRVKEHPIYRKKFRMSTRISVHDPEGRAREGAKVRITETRPLSKTKHFILTEILETPAPSNPSRSSLSEEAQVSESKAGRPEQESKGEGDAK